MLSAVRRTLPTPSACSPATPGSTSALSRASSSSHSTGSSRRHSRIWGSDRAGSEGIAPRNSSCRMCPGCQQRTKLGQLLRSHLGQSGRLLALPSPILVLEQRIVRPLGLKTAAAAHLSTTSAKAYSLHVKGPIVDAVLDRVFDLLLHCRWRDIDRKLGHGKLISGSGSSAGMIASVACWLEWLRIEGQVPLKVWRCHRLFRADTKQIRHHVSFQHHSNCGPEAVFVNQQAFLQREMST
eukprot:COSAG06_NODE_902_length_11648_cov_8.947441_5_plen_239_part_00